MDANTLRIGLMLIILVWSVISAITYMARRSDNKGALRELKQEGQPLRRLSAEEQALVQPFLVRPAKPTQRVALLNDGVFPLRGAFVRHGLESGHGAATMHDTLGGVDVVLPYDARDYLREDNQAEVVMTEKFAIVVALNGEFDLAGGREREARRQKQNQQWSSGKLGEMQNVVDADAAAAQDAGNASDAHAEREFADAMRVEILSQREETPAEIAWRRPSGIAFWPALLWLAAFVCLGVAAAGGGLAWLASAAAPALLAVWLTWRRRPLGAAQKVNRCGANFERDRADQSGQRAGGVDPAVPGRQAAGDAARPLARQPGAAGRRPRRRGPAGGRLRRAAPGQPLFGGRGAAPVPSVAWGRHVTLALAGLIAGVALGLIDGADLRGDIALASAWARGAQPRVYDSAAALVQDPPAPGDLVSLKGAGRCQFQPDAYRQGEVRFDCERIRWQGEAIRADELRVAPAALQLYSGAFLKTRPNPMMDMLVRNQVYGSLAGNPLAAYNARNVSAVTVSRVTDLVLTIELACESATGQAIAECDRLKAETVDSLMLARDEPDNWLALLQLAQGGAFKQRGNADEGVIITRAANQLRGLAKSSMEPQLREVLARAGNDLMARQRGGVVLQVWPGRYADLSSLMAREEMPDMLQSWSRQVAMLAADGAQPFQAAGVVTAVEREASGDTVVDVDARRSLDDPWPSLARVIWLAAALLLVIVHGVLAALRLRAAAARKRGLAEYARRPVAARPAFF